MSKLELGLDYQKVDVMTKTLEEKVRDSDTVKQYDTLLDELFELLDRVEETDEGRKHRPVQIICTREADRAKLNSVLFLLKHAREYRV